MISAKHPTLSPESEAQKLLSLCGGDLLRAISMIENQFNVLHTRAQVTLSLAGIVITVTGFSGRLIAATSFISQLFLVTGLFTVLLSAIYTYTRVVKLKWLTSLIEDTPQQTISKIIGLRNTKTGAFTTGGFILAIGLMLYCVAISIMLFNPVPVSLPVR